MNEPQGPVQPKTELYIDLLALLRALFAHKVLLSCVTIMALAAGYATYRVLPKKYRATVNFAFQSSPSASSRLQQLAALAGNINMKTENSPFVAHLESFAQSHEVTMKMLAFRYKGSPLPEVLLERPPTSRDSLYAFHAKLNSMCEVKRRDDAFELTCAAKDPALTAFLAENMFQTIAVSIEEKRRESVSRKLGFVDSIATTYRQGYDAASDRLKTFMMKNMDVTSPELLQRREQLMLEKRMAEERYLMSIKEQEELRIQYRQEDAPLVVIEKAYVPLFPFFPSKPASLALALAIGLAGYIAIIAVRDRKLWLKLG